MRAIYITSDNLDPNSGAGIVCIHEVAALKKAIEDFTYVGHIPDVKVVSRKDVIGVSKYDFNPFLFDYFAARTVPEEWDRDAPGTLNTLVPVDLLHLSCSPGMAILDAVRPRHYVTNIVAHDLQESIHEHERYFGPGSYSLKHNTDPYLHEMLLKHAEGADAILTPSTASEKWIRANIKNPRVTVIPHGTEIPATITPLYAQHPFKAGYLGAFGPDKGLLYLLMAWNYFGGGTLVFGGNCKDGVQWLAKQMLIDLVSLRYEFTGWVDKVSDFYNDIDVYIQPSVSEGFGIEIIEAMAHGRPVIATTGTCGPDVITDGVEGFIVPPRDPMAILEKVRFFRDHPEKIAEMGGNARLRAKEYSWERIEERYVQFYKRILSPPVVMSR